MKVILSLLLTVISTTLFSQTSDTLPPPPPPLDTVMLGDKIFERVEIESFFPGGENEWIKYLMKNLDPNVPVEHGAPIGIYTVIAQFIVDKAGTISEIKTLTNFGYGMEEEVRRIIIKSPPWTPAEQNNRKVRAYRKQPVTFVIEDDAVEIIMDEKYILYTDKENKIRVNVDKVKKDDLKLTISQGTITADEDGSFIITVKTQGKAILYFNQKNRKKELGSVYFIVKKKT